LPSTSQGPKPPKSEKTERSKVLAGAVGLRKPGNSRVWYHQEWILLDLFHELKTVPGTEPKEYKLVVPVAVTHVHNGSYIRSLYERLHEHTESHETRVNMLSTMIHNISYLLWLYQFFPPPKVLFYTTRTSFNIEYLSITIKPSPEYNEPKQIHFIFLETSAYAQLVVRSKSAFRPFFKTSDLQKTMGNKPSKPRSNPTSGTSKSGWKCKKNIEEREVSSSPPSEHSDTNHDRRKNAALSIQQMITPA
jgi:hypothetical protein